MRRLISELAGLLGAYDTTTFLVGEYREQDIHRIPSSPWPTGSWSSPGRSIDTDERFLRVSKLRGSGYLEGLHGIHITSAGLEVYPRLVSPDDARGITVPARAGAVPGSTGWTHAGVRSLAREHHPGRRAHRLGQDHHWDSSSRWPGVACGEPALYVNFQENPTQLARVIGALAGDVAALQQRGPSPAVRLFGRAPDRPHHRRDVPAHREHGIRRVVIDAMGDLSLAAVDLQRIHNYLYALVQRFTVRASPCSSCSRTSPTARWPAGPGGPAEFGRLSYMCDNLLLLEIHRGERLEPAAQHLQDPGERPRRGCAPDHHHRARGPCRVTCSRRRPRGVLRGRRGGASPADGAEPCGRAGGIARQTSWISPRGRPPACSTRSRRS